MFARPAITHASLAPAPGFINAPAATLSPSESSTPKTIDANARMASMKMKLPLPSTACLVTPVVKLA